MKISILALLLLLIPSAGFACKMHGDPWFLQTITIDESTLPKNIAWVATSTESGSPITGLFQTENGILLKNITEIPYILIGRNITAYHVKGLVYPYPPELQPILGPSFSGEEKIYKLVNGETYWWGPRHGKHVWNKSDFEFYLQPSILEQLGDSQSLCAGGKISCGRTSDRPNGIANPPPTSFEINTYYDQKLTVLKGTITFEPTPNYVSQSEARPCGHDRDHDLDNVPLQALFIVFTPPALILFAIGYYIFQPRKRAQLKP